MKLKNVELIPGVVVDDIDPEFMGRVKVAAPGEFDTETGNVDDMFWAYPFPIGGYQSFSRMFKGSKVWLIVNTENYYEYWYLPYLTYNANTHDKMNTKKKYVADIVISRDLGGRNVQYYYNDVDGFNQILDNANLNVQPNGTITFNSGGADVGHANLHTNANVNEIGWDDEKEALQWAARGENLAKAFGELSQQFSLIKDICGDQCPYTAHLTEPFRVVSEIFGKYVKEDGFDVRAKHVKVN